MTEKSEVCKAELHEVNNIEEMDAHFARMTESENPDIAAAGRFFKAIFPAYFEWKQDEMARLPMPYFSKPEDVMQILHGASIGVANIIMDSYVASYRHISMGKNPSREALLSAIEVTHQSLAASANELADNFGQKRN